MKTFEREMLRLVLLTIAKRNRVIHCPDCDRPVGIFDMVVCGVKAEEIVRCEKHDCPSRRDWHDFLISPDAVVGFSGAFWKEE